MIEGSEIQMRGVQKLNIPVISEVQQKKETSLGKMLETLSYSVTRGEAWFLSFAASLVSPKLGVDPKTSTILNFLPLYMQFGIKAKDNRMAHLEEGGERYLLGRHGELTPFKYRGRTKVLEDGTVVNPGNLLHRIDLVRNLTDFEGMDATMVSKFMVKDFLGALIQLAQDIKTGKFGQNTVAFTGVSHLAGTKLTEKLGFEVDDPDLSDKLTGTITGFLFKKGSKGTNEFNQKWKKTKRVWMTPRQVVENEQNFKDILNRYFRQPILVNNLDHS